ncbi:MAG: hypothetical protein K2J99_12230 [Lachnospiraceae bacterium]|nr:hypothetical protein [Lachnospiraceae bacterium]
MKSIYEILIENAINERLDEIISLDKEYLMINAQLNVAQQEYTDLKLPKEQIKIIDFILIFIYQLTSQIPSTPETIS